MLDSSLISHDVHCHMTLMRQSCDDGSLVVQYNNIGCMYVRLYMVIVDVHIHLTVTYLQVAFSKGVYIMYNTCIYINICISLGPYILEHCNILCVGLVYISHSV